MMITANVVRMQKPKHERAQLSCAAQIDSRIPWSSRPKHLEIYISIEVVSSLLITSDFDCMHSQRSFDEPIVRASCSASKQNARI